MLLPAMNNLYTYIYVEQSMYLNIDTRIPGTCGKLAAKALPQCAARSAAVSNRLHLQLDLPLGRATAVASALKQLH